MWLNVERSLAIITIVGLNLGQGAVMLWKVTARLTESNGSRPPGGWLQVTGGLTAYTPGSAPGPTLSNEYGKTLPFIPALPNCRFQHHFTNLSTIMISYHLHSLAYSLSVAYSNGVQCTLLERSFTYVG